MASKKITKNTDEIPYKNVVFYSFIHFNINVLVEIDIFNNYFFLILRIKYNINNLHEHVFYDFV